MAKPTGFMEFSRELPADRSPEERICDWKEFHTLFSEEKQRRQSARCMDCGIPFCHTGILINNMVSGCPLNNLIPEWNEQVYRGLWKEAYDRLNKTNNFPEFTGRVCPAPCEEACTVGLHDPMITIKQNECHIINRAFEKDLVQPFVPLKRTGKKVAVVGSGPSGLAAADQLNKAGHLVTVYERADRPGGLLMYGIPNMKLEKKTVLRRISLMEKSGIQFITGTEVGKDVLLENLLRDNDAVILCCGATRPRDLCVEGRDLRGIHFAMDFLTANTQALLDQKSAENIGKGRAGAPIGAISAEGKNVVIIGGGDTGTDCVGTCLRHGAKSVCQLEIMPEPPIERDPENPWPQWSKILRTDYGQEEAISLTGKDPRIWLTTAKRFSGDKKGNLKNVHTVSVRWEKDASGAIRPVEIPGTEKEIKTELVLLAMGFLGPEDTVFGSLEVARDKRSNIAAEYGSFATSIPGLFAAGDARRGQSLVVWAIHEGREAARECDRFLSGESFLPSSFHSAVPHEKQI